MSSCIVSAVPAVRANPSQTLRVNATTSPLPARGPLAAKVARMFGLSAGADAQVLYDNFDLPIRPGEITAVVGPSGAGKTALLALAAAGLANGIWLEPDRLARSKQPPVALLRGGTFAGRLAMLSRCGLAEARVLVTPARQLSGGQLYRLALAYALHEALRRPGGAVVLADEFATCLDDLTARNLCRQLRRLVSGSKVALLLATPRSDLLDHLQVDQAVVKPLDLPPRLIRFNEANAAETTVKSDTPSNAIETTVKADAPDASRATLKRTRLGVLPTSSTPKANNALRVARTHHITCGRAKTSPVPRQSPTPHDPRSWPIQRGSIADYRELAKFHYIAGPPAAHKRVYVIRDPAVDGSTGGDACSSGRASPATSVAGLMYPSLAAVLVMSPPLACVASRNVATEGRYCRGPMRDDLALLNAEMECISRVIVHPAYRGLGLAVGLVRHALATAQRPRVEALAVMGHVHPLFCQAGMKAYYRPANAPPGKDYVYYLWGKT